MGACREHDWAIDVDVPPVQPTVEQQLLLADLERVLASFGMQPAEPRAVTTVVAPLVHQLHESGMTQDRIAAHSRIRPEDVARILDGDLRGPA